MASYTDETHRGPRKRSLGFLIFIVTLAAGGSIILLFAVWRSRLVPAPSDSPAQTLKTAPAEAIKKPAHAKPKERWAESFSSGALDASRWMPTFAGDFKERASDVVKSGTSGEPEFRLRLRAGTLETDAESIKYLGVRGVPAIHLRPEARIHVDLDWNSQRNGSYLTAGMVLAPQETAENPLTGPDWLKVEYIGVPPGRNARLLVAQKTNGQELTLFTDGWPDANRTGRIIYKQRLELVIHDGAFQLWENERLVYDGAGRALSFDTAHLYLQMSSHSNYPAREVYFSNIFWETDSPEPVNAGG